MLQLTGVVDERSMRAQYLDRMDIERERGITIKAQNVRLPWRISGGPDAGKEYVLHLIDTPGHVDFTYEVSRALAACEGAVLLVDAAQGIEAQTLANLYLALDRDLVIIPVLNKIDLPAADPDRYAAEIAHIIGCQPADVLRVSGKTGEGVAHLLDEVVRQVPPPRGDADAPTRAMIFDSVYDTYRGVVTYVRVVDGKITPRERIAMMSTGATHELLEVGIVSPEPSPPPDSGRGGGVSDHRREGRSPVQGRRHRHHRAPRRDRTADRLPRTQTDGVFGPVSGRRLGVPRVARCAGPATAQRRRAHLRTGNLGGARFRIPLRLFGIAAHGDHPRAAGTRIRPRPDLDLAQRRLPGGQRRRDGSPSDQSVGLAVGQDPHRLRARREDHHHRAQRIHRHDHGAVPVAPRRTGRHGLSVPERVELRYRMPLGEIIFDFFDALKSRTRGYASLDYEEAGEQEAELVKVDILLQGEPVDAFSAIVHKDAAAGYGHRMTAKLKELIPRQQFEVPVQAAIGSKIITRENIRAIRKDVLSKCYGGDITRKRKLLERQKEGKKRMKTIGRVDVPQEAFVAALSTDVGGDKTKK
ncbi:GTP-binding protein LepA [Mycobacterium xenopi 4042]|uniref:Elongation factor 4 n=1 Tax=Mycobacterium xenopi 4042 TaxID=1299334 RepID=X8AR79_MYCXE|nr:GTP-binding protein LepA [Mycobacterium xenopi 4042]